MNFLVLLILCGSYLQMVRSEVYVSIKFVSIRYNGSCCDVDLHGICLSECDFRFTICMDRDNSSDHHNISSCFYGDMMSDEIPNQNSINFENRIASLENPMIWKLPSWPGKVVLKIRVEDIDVESKDLVDFISTYISGNPSSSSRVLRATLGSRVSLNIEVSLYCGQDYYSNNCSIFCKSTNDDSGHYTCNSLTGEKICYKGYSGPACEVDIDECDSSPCHNGGQCTNMVGQFTCQCPAGFTGTNCESDIDECDVTHDTVCQNGATCHNSPGSYQCTCTSGYHGNQCENDIDECVMKPCSNGGTCHNVPGDFYCQCPAGYTGKKCKDNINKCLSDICKNGGTCIDLDGSFKCTCSSYWEGTTCQENVNECISEPCQNGGTCEDVNEGYVCACPREYLGHHCEEDLNECDFPDTCANNGTCFNNFGGFVCSCLDGWQGETCDEDINECESFSCNNSGWCINTHGSFRCSCPITWSGFSCEVDVDECDFCDNYKTCYNIPGWFVCNCQQGWTGLLCKVDVDECKLEPDLCITTGHFSHFNSSDVGNKTIATSSHMLCVNTQPGFLCSCMEGWTGQFCDVDIESLTEPITTSAITQVSDMTTFDVVDNIDQTTMDTPVTSTEDGLNGTADSDNGTDTSYWYPVLIPACVVVIIIVIVVVFIKFKRQQGSHKTCKKTSVNISVTSRQQDNHDKTCEPRTDPRDTAMLVKSSSKMITTQNPLYTTLEDEEMTERGGGSFTNTNVKVDVELSLQSHLTTPQMDNPSLWTAPTWLPENQPTDSKRMSSASNSACKEDMSAAERVIPLTSA